MVKVYKNLNKDENGNYYFIFDGIRQKTIHQEDTLLLIYILENLIENKPYQNKEKK